MDPFPAMILLLVIVVVHFKIVNVDKESNFISGIETGSRLRFNLAHPFRLWHTVGCDKMKIDSPFFWAALPLSLSLLQGLPCSLSPLSIFLFLFAYLPTNVALHI